ncbi:MAG: hypothetical protein IKQ91_07055, partial [Oscillospiraceae bacterium]|nr:hypothetical protein [Oscillospiraceae bacterium]
RFDPAKSVIHFRADDTETECSFTQAVQQINQLAANLPVINDLADKAEDRIRKGTKEKGLHEAVQNYKDAGYNGAFCAFVLDSIYEYALYHNEEIMRIKLKTVGGHLKDQVQPGFEQLRRLLTASPAGTMPELDGFSLFQPVQAEIIGGQTWYSSVFPCNAFLLMFRDVLQMTGSAVCTCTVCGDYFCGKAEDDCCGNPDCKKYLESSEPYQKKEDLSAITRCFSGRIRSIRHELREICETEEAVTEFNEFSKPLQTYVTSTVRALRIADAPVMKIRKFKNEVDRLYDELNARRKQILEKMQFGSQFLLTKCN